MKTKLALSLLALSLSTCSLQPVLAADYEVGVGINQLKIDWIGHTEFSPEMITVEGAVWSDYDIGLRAQYGISNKSDVDTGDEIWIDPIHSTIYPDTAAKMEWLYTVGVVYKYDITDVIGIETSVGYMEYMQSVENFQYEGYENKDVNIFYSVGIRYQYDTDINVRLNATRYHKKEKWSDLETDGTEATYGLGLTVTYSF